MTVDKSHPVFDGFDAAGYRREDLIDPGNVTRGDLRESDGTWRAVQWKSVGIEAFDVEAVTESEWSPSGVVAVLSYGEQPIGFADEHGLLNEEIPPLKHLQAAANPSITMFWPPHAERSAPELDKAAAVEALSVWGSEGFLPRVAAEAIAEPFGVDLADSIFRDDPDVDGEEIVRATHVAPKLAAAEFGEAKSADSGLGGHKKTRRQRFYRNLDPLKERFGIE